VEGKAGVPIDTSCQGGFDLAIAAKAECPHLVVEGMEKLAGLPRNAEPEGGREGGREMY